MISTILRQDIWKEQVDNRGQMLGIKAHSHIEAHLKLMLWKVEPFVGVM